MEAQAQQTHSDQQQDFSQLVGEGGSQEHEEAEQRGHLHRHDKADEKARAWQALGVVAGTCTEYLAGLSVEAKMDWMGTVIFCIKRQYAATRLGSGSADPPGSIEPSRS